MVSLFGIFYIKSYLFYFYYIFVFLRFLVVIIMFNLIYGFHLLFFVWDILGIISFFLVIYYLNWDSLSGSLRTVISNRWGDLFLIYFLVIEYSISSRNLINIKTFFLFLGELTKRSQFPFFGWLVKAMVAPTPVRSLVHSRTLVVSGCFLIFVFFERYSNFIILRLIMVSLGGLIISFILSLVEDDFKKLIAWRTISQVSLIFLFFSFGWFFYSFFYLINHALFKCLIFLSTGIKINYEKGNQDNRFNKNEKIVFYDVIFILGYCLLSRNLFSGSIIIKDLIIEILMYDNDLMIIFFLFIFVFIRTNFYSLKLLIFFYKSIFNTCFYITFLGSLSLFFLSFLRYYYLYFTVQNFFIFGINCIEDISLWFWFVFHFFYFFFFNLSLFLLNRKFFANYWFKLFIRFFLLVIFSELILNNINLLLIYIFNLINNKKYILMFGKYFFYILLLMVFLMNIIF